MKNISPEQSLLTVVIANETHDIKRLILAGLRNGDPETVIRAIQRATAVIGRDAAIRGGLELIDQFANGAFGSENVDA